MEKSPSVRGESRSRSRSAHRERNTLGQKQVAAHTGLQEVADIPAFDLRTPTEYFWFFCGLIILLVAGPPCGIIMFSALTWEAVDRGFEGGFTQSGKELTGLLLANVVPGFTRLTQRFNERFVKRPQDAYMMNCMWGFGILVPIMFFYCAKLTYEAGRMSWLVLYVYHVIRIGPFFQNFAYMYTLCHKEGHTRVGLFTQPYNTWMPVRNWFNWWAGMFYGVLPATFAYGHSINHHKYNNGYHDIISNADKPRDSFVNWVAYLPRFFLYAVNITTVQQFAREGNWKVVRKVIAGSLYYFAWVGLWSWLVSPQFAVAYLVLPFAESSLLLAAVNFSWHAFQDPVDPENEYVYSITILDGPVNVLNEDAHVVHHAYPAAHWTDHPKHLENNWEKYVDKRASVFRGTHAFEIFGMEVARDYDAMAQKFVDVQGERNGNPLSHEQKVNLLKQRLRACTWGPRVDAETHQLSASGMGYIKKDS